MSPFFRPTLTRKGFRSCATFAKGTATTKIQYLTWLTPRGANGTGNTSVPQHTRTEWLNMNLSKAERLLLNLAHLAQRSQRFALDVVFRNALPVRSLVRWLTTSGFGHPTVLLATSLRRTPGTSTLLISKMTSISLYIKSAKGPCFVPHPGSELCARSAVGCRTIVLWCACLHAST